MLTINKMILLLATQGHEITEGEIRYAYQTGKIPMPNDGEWWPAGVMLDEIPKWIASHERR